MEKLKNIDVAMLGVIGIFLLLMCFPEEGISAMNGEIRVIGEKDLDMDLFQKWLLNDSTKDQLYDNETYDCKGFSRDLVMNASKKDFAVYYAVIEYDDGSENHKMNAVFNKTFLLVEPQTGEIYNLSQFILKDNPKGVFILSANEKFVKRLY